MAGDTTSDGDLGPAGDGTSVDGDARHAAKMAKKKTARDKMMAGKSGENGLLIVLTGAGKGKSSSAFGMILRAIAHRGASRADAAPWRRGSGSRDGRGLHLGDPR